LVGSVPQPVTAAATVTVTGTWLRRYDTFLALGPLFPSELGLVGYEGCEYNCFARLPKHLIFGSSKRFKFPLYRSSYRLLNADFEDFETALRVVVSFVVENACGGTYKVCN
jgi:hypothetical protein